MIRALLVVLRAFPAWLLELVGAALVVAGVVLLAGDAWGLIAAGVALILKAFERDLKADL